MPERKKKNWANNKHQIPNPHIEIISKFQAPNIGFKNCLGHRSLVIGYYLGLVI
jgi:hypothetical protein